MGSTWTPDASRRCCGTSGAPYGAHARIRFPEQVDAISRLLSDDDGLVVAAGIVCEAADEAHADLQSQAQEMFRRTGRRLLVHRRNYRPLWKEAGPALRWPLGALPSGLHPYAQVTAAVAVIGDRAKRLGRVTDPQPFVARLFEVLDLTTAGWEFGRVRVDTDGAALVERLTVTAAQVLAAMDDPPRLPPAVREMMRRNHRIDVYDPAGPGWSAGSTWARGCARPSWPDRGGRDRVGRTPPGRGASHPAQVVVQVRFVGGLLVPFTEPMKPKVVDAPAASAPL